MTVSRAGFFTHRALVAALAVLAFVCGVLAVGWKRAHDRAECWREVAEEQVSAAGDCDR